MKNFYNPSFVGETNNIESSLLHRRQWMGITNAPVTSLVSINMPLSLFGKDHGVGALVSNDKIGLYTNTYTFGQYTYKWKFKKNRVLNIGIQGGMANVDFDASKVVVYDGSVKPAGGGGKSIDGGLGVSWVTRSYYMGLSVTHLLEPTIDISENSSLYLARTYYLVGGYNIRLNNPFFELQPSALFKTDAVTYQLDLTAKMEYGRMFNGGISWRKGDGFVFLLGVRIKNIDAGYSYDLSTSAIAKASNGTHELFLRYSIPIEKKKEAKRSKSIRIL